MSALLNWKSFEYKFDGREQEAFEKLAYAVFCRKYGLTGGVPRKFDQWHIETDPVKVGNDYIGFQAKYYLSPTVNGDQARALIDTVRKAHERYPQLTVLEIYLANEFSESKNSVIPKRKEEIEKVAAECEIRIEWVLPSNLEILLNEAAARDIKEYFFPVLHIESETTDFSAYYERIKKRFTRKKKEDESPVGTESDKDAYIEAYTSVNDEQIPVLTHLEKWFRSSEYGTRGLSPCSSSNP